MFSSGNEKYVDVVTAASATAQSGGGWFDKSTPTAAANGEEAAPSDAASAQSGNHSKWTDIFKKKTDNTEEPKAAPSDAASAQSGNHSKWTDIFKKKTDNTEEPEAAPSGSAPPPSQPEKSEGGVLDFFRRKKDPSAAPEGETKDASADDKQAAAEKEPVASESERGAAISKELGELANLIPGGPQVLKASLGALIKGGPDDINKFIAKAGGIDALIKGGPAGVDKLLAEHGDLAALLTDGGDKGADALKSAISSMTKTFARMNGPEGESFLKTGIDTLKGGIGAFIKGGPEGVQEFLKTIPGGLGALFNGGPEGVDRLLAEHSDVMALLTDGDKGAEALKKALSGMAADFAKGGLATAASAASAATAAHDIDPKTKSVTSAFYLLHAWFLRTAAADSTLADHCGRMQPMYEAFATAGYRCVVTGDAVLVAKQAGKAFLGADKTLVAHDRVPLEDAKKNAVAWLNS
jgi:hypothetical protein